MTKALPHWHQPLLEAFTCSMLIVVTMIMSLSPPAVAAPMAPSAADFALMAGTPHVLCLDEKRLCYIANNLTVICTDDSANEWADVQMNVLACGSTMCGLDTRGNVHCLSGSSRDHQRDALPLGTFVSLFAPNGYTTSGVFSCALNHLGVTSCWGNVNKMGWAVQSLSQYQWRVLSATTYRICGLRRDDNKLYCYEQTPSQWLDYANDTSWVSLDCKSYLTSYCCGLLANGITRCWGERYEASFVSSVLDVPQDQRFARIWLGSTSVCGRLINNTDSLLCWGHLWPPNPQSVTPPEALGVRATDIVDMACNHVRCAVILSNTQPHQTHNRTSSESRLVVWPPLTWTTDGDQVTPLIPNTYHALYGCVDSNALVCAALDDIRNDSDIYHAHQTPDHLAWHCRQPNPDKRIPATKMNRIKQLSWYTPTDVGHYLLENGTVIGFQLTPRPPGDTAHQVLDAVPSVDQTFIDVCTVADTACAIRTNGTILCWSGPTPHPPLINDPASGGAIHDDYIAIECAGVSFCATRANLDVYCWGHQQGTRGPWPLLRSSVYNYYGIDSGHRVWEWSTNQTITTDEPVVDLTGDFRSDDTCTCLIHASGTLNCTRCGAPSQSLSRLAMVDTEVTGPLNASNHLTSTGLGGICLVIEGMVTCSGPSVTRFRWGGYAMQPRASLSRTIHIATDGVDTVFCGLHYFKPCATINYAMTLIESSGPWVTFMFAGGVYWMREMTTIDWTGVTIMGSTNASNPTVWHMYARFVIGAPSFRLSHIRFAFGSFPAPTPLILVNTGVIDVVISNCLYSLSNGIIEVSTSASLTLASSNFTSGDFSTGILVSNGRLWMHACHWYDTPTNAIIAMGASITVTNSSFTNVAPGAQLMLASGSASRFIVRGCQFRNVEATSGVIVLQQVQFVTIEDSVFDTVSVKRSDETGGGAISAMYSHGNITRCTFTHVSVQCMMDANHDQLCQANVIMLTGFGKLVITESSFINNGGATFSKGLIGCHTSSQIVLRRVYSSGNRAGIAAGGVYGHTCLRLDVTDFVANDNTALSQYASMYGYGGVFYTLLTGQFIITNSSFTRNFAFVGGVVVIGFASSLQLTGWTRWSDNQAANLGSVWVFRDGIHGPHITGDDHIWSHNTVTSPYGQGRDDELITDIAHVVLLSGDRGGGTIITNHTSGDLLPTLVFGAFDSYDHRVTARPLYDYLKLTLRPAVIPPPPVFDLSGEIEIVLRTIDAWVSIAPTINFTNVIATAPPGSTQTYSCAWTAYRLTDTIPSVPLSSTFTVHYRYCHKGEYNDNNICRECVWGRYTPSYGNNSVTVCELCDRGRYQGNPGHSSCDACRSGWYQASRASYFCNQCDQGTYASEPGATACATCEYGSYQPEKGQPSCHLCRHGSHQKVRGQADCLLCSAGTYSIDDGATDCALCEGVNGLTCDSDGNVRIEHDYWSWRVAYNSTAPSGETLTNRKLLTVPCVRGRCIGGQYGVHTGDDIINGTYEPCGENRLQTSDNIMCGHCLPGHTELGTSCIKCKEPDTGLILLVIIIIFGLVGTLHVVAQTASGLPSIFFYFVQMSLLMLPSASKWLSWISLFGGTTATTVFGICIAPMTAGQQMILSLCSILLFWTALVIILAVQSLLSRVPRCSLTIKRTCYPRQRYWRSAMDIYLFSYSTIAKTLVGYMSCVDAGLDTVIYIEPTISCTTSNYNQWLAVIVILLVGGIIVPPVAFIIYLTRNRYRFADTRFISRFGTLYEPFTSRAYWWASFVLLRRATFTMVDIGLVTLPAFKYMIFTILHLMSLVIHVLIQPYATILFNRMELMTLMVLTLLSIILTAFTDTKQIERFTSVQVMITLVVVMPLPIFGIYAMQRLRRMVTRKTCAQCWSTVTSYGANNIALNPNDDDDLGEEEGEDADNHGHDDAIINHDNDNAHDSENHRHSQVMQTYVAMPAPPSSS